MLAVECVEASAVPWGWGRVVLGEKPVPGWLTDAAVGLRVHELPGLLTERRLQQRQRFDVQCWSECLRVCVCVLLCWPCTDRALNKRTPSPLKSTYKMHLASNLHAICLKRLNFFLPGCPFLPTGAVGLLHTF
jgi:hypothetical protein